MKQNKIIFIIKIIGIILLFVLSFGLLNKLDLINLDEMSSKELDAISNKNNNKINKIKKDKKEINEEKIKVKGEIYNTKKRIEELEEEIENKKIDKSAIKYKDARNHLRRLASE